MIGRDLPGEDFTAPPVTAARPISVVTRAIFAASPDQVWKVLMFYEEVGQPPPLHLRLLLPVPIRTEGRISEVGDEMTCVYEGGHLRKRTTRIAFGDHYEFEVTEQALSFGGGIRLSEGCFALRVLPDGRTEVSLETRYRSGRSPRWLWKLPERMVCHAFHRHLMGSMRRRIESA